MDVLERKRQQVLDYLAPHLDDGERVETTIALASGPAWPMATLIPIVGFAVMATRLYRAYAIIVTDRRVLLVRRQKHRPEKPQGIDVSVPRDRVSIESWVKRRPTSGRLTLDLDGHRRRLYVIGMYQDDVPAMFDALGYTPPPPRPSRRG